MLVHDFASEKSYSGYRQVQNFRLKVGAKNSNARPILIPVSLSFHMRRPVRRPYNVVHLNTLQILYLIRDNQQRLQQRACLKLQIQARQQNLGLPMK